MTDEELKELVAGLAVAQAETDRQIEETNRQLRQTDRQLRELGKQIGGLGEKFGGFTEGMAFPSMQKILQERFRMGVVGTRIKARRNGRSMELDVLAYSNSDVDEVYVVEVKSRLREKHIEQMLEKMREFPTFFPLHRGKKLFGIMAAVDVSDELRDRALRNGFYLAKIHDEVFELAVPDDFKPRVFQL